MKIRVIETVLGAINAHYVYPDVAEEMERYVRQHIRSGDYAEIKTLETLTARLHEDLRSVSHDRHIRVKVMSPDDFEPAIGQLQSEEKIAGRRKRNFGFRSVEWLPGNVGLLRFDRFDDPAYAGDTAAAAMAFLADCDAIIFDLRYNPGGHEKMVRLLASYFYAEPKLLGSLYFAETDELKQSWTNSYVPGKKPLAAELYILTSRDTGSGAEGFSYSMKNGGRATVVGERTRGAAHWAEYYDFPELGVRAKIPVARPINPVTGTSWERVGVEPDIPVPASRALSTAYVHALDTLIARSTDEAERRDLEWEKAAAVARTEPLSLGERDLQRYTGLFEDGEFAIHIRGGHLFWRYSDGTDYLLVPLAGDLFGFDDSEEQRISITFDDHGHAAGFRLLSRDGDSGPLHPKSGDVEPAGKPSPPSS